VLPIEGAGSWGAFCRRESETLRSMSWPMDPWLLGTALENAKKVLKAQNRALNFPYFVKEEDSCGM
jgi:hypothetical protein